MSVDAQPRVPVLPRVYWCKKIHESDLVNGANQSLPVWRVSSREENSPYSGLAGITASLHAVSNK